MGHWGRGLCVTATGVSADQRQHVREVVEAAGGRHVFEQIHRNVALYVPDTSSDSIQRFAGTVPTSASAVHTS